MYLKDLSEAHGVSGDEGAVREIIVDAIKDHVTDMQVDSMGNLTAFKKGTGERNLRVMLAAHMDEVGFMAMGFDGNGLIRFTNVGGIDARLLPGLRVKIGKDAIPGVIIWTPIHINRDQSVKKVKDLRIDIGATKKGGAEAKVKRGDRIVFDSYYDNITDTIVRGKAFDDRVGCSLLIDVLRGGDYPVDIAAAFTVQEEIGLRGVRVAARRLKPDTAIVLEGTTAHDLPNPTADPDDSTRPNPVCKIGSGPVLSVMDRSMITPPQLLRFYRQVADDHNILYQLKTAPGGGTDGGQ
ncbi:MAG: M42 family metallopeptidase, partial [Aggregatilineales bacterium]